jgi:hypothetical protein
MIVEFANGVTAASGTLCKNKNGSRVIVTTRRAPSNNPNKIRMYLRSASSYQRKGKPSKKELHARSLFTVRQEYVTELLAAGKVSSRADAWKLAKLAYPVDRTAE